MVLDLSFGYPDNFCESPRRQRSNHEQIHDALSRGALGWKHTVILIVYSCCQRTAGSSFPTFAFHAHVSLSLLPTEQKFLDHFAQIWATDLLKLIPHTATRGGERNQVTQINGSRDHNYVTSNCGDSCSQVLKLSGRITHCRQRVGDPGITAKDFGQAALGVRPWIDDLCGSVALGGN